MSSGPMLVAQHAGDGAGLGDLLGFQAFAFQHVDEIRVAAEVQLIGVIQVYAAVDEQAGQHTVQDGGAHLALDIIADDRQAAFGKPLAPVFRGGDEDRDGS